MRQTKVTSFAPLFWIAAILVLILGLDVVWWQAILVTLLANLDFRITTTRGYR